MPTALSTVPPMPATDRECLEAWRRDQSAENLKPLIERYGALVYSSVCRRIGSENATEVTRAVFLVLARRARKLSKKTVLAGWLFQLTGRACRNRISLLRRIARWFCYRRRYVPKPDEALWTRVAPLLDRALQRLSAKRRNAVLLCAFLNHDVTSAGSILRTRPRRVQKRLTRGMRKLAKRLGTRRAPVDPATFASACKTEGCATAVPEGLVLEVLQSIEASRGKRPSLKLARRTLRSLGWARWRRRLVVGAVAWHVLLVIVGAIIWRIDAPTGRSRLISAFIVWSIRFQAMRTAERARPWPTDAATPRLEAGTVRNARDIYQTTNIWLAHLDFTREQWKALGANYIGPLPNFFRPDGLVDLRNPRAQRSGVAGVLGYEFDWTRAGFEFSGLPFTNVAVRVKGNLGSLCTAKRSFKVDLNKLTKGQKFGGVDELTFNNLVWDYSFLHEALGYEFFRDAGVPAPRTAFAWFSTSVATRWDRKPFGLYLMVESVGEEFAKEQFGSKRTPVFKPVTYKLFEHLGDEWSAYAAIYDLKTEATLEQQRRVIDFARLVSSATDAEFAAQVGDFLDVDEFARFLAVQVLLSHYDSILSLGQNFFMYLHPRSNKFGFIPWDLDSAWGHFWLAEKEEFERASIWHPWVGENRFIERVMAVEEFRRIYRGHLEDFLARVFVPERLHRRIDEMAVIIRDPIAAESVFRLDKFEQAVGLTPLHPTPGETKNGVNHPPHQLKPFIESRARSVRRQLDGKSKGVIVKTPRQKRE